MTDDKGKNVLAVSLIAGLAGAAAGVLFAPSSGRETRAKIKHHAENMRGKAESTLEAGKDKSKRLKDRLTSAAAETGRKVKQGYDETREDLAESTSKRHSSTLS